MRNDVLYSTSLNINVEGYIFKIQVEKLSCSDVIGDPKPKLEFLFTAKTLPNDIVGKTVSWARSKQEAISTLEKLVKLKLNFNNFSF